MPGRRKLPPDLVTKAAKALEDPATASKQTIKRLAAVVLDDQQYDPKPHKGGTTKKTSAPSKAAPKRKK